MKVPNTCLEVLPDIEIFGGDTTPLQLRLMHENGNGYGINEVYGYTATLYLLPYYMSTGVGVDGTPVLTKSGTFKVERGETVVEFALAESDTKSLAGKFIYQVEFVYGSAHRIGQGKIHIRPNIYQPQT